MGYNYSYRHHEGNKIGAVAMLVIFALGIIAGYFFGSFLQKPAEPQAGQCAPIIPQNVSKATPATIESSVTIYLPAVDKDGNGVAMPLTVQRRAGYGETLIDINNLIFWFDTQQSIQTAKAVAEGIANVDMQGINLVYIINANASLVGGPSAGAALTIATIAALQNKTLNNSVIITGTIESDGTIGKVGGILEKAGAAKAVGAKLFLVPVGQASEKLLKPTETCTQRFGFTYCRIEYEDATIDISKTAGIPVTEVSTIQEAEKYFFS